MGVRGRGGGKATPEAAVALTLLSRIIDDEARKLQQGINKLAFCFLSPRNRDENAARLRIKLRGNRQFRVQQTNARLTVKRCT